jgi:hypothetical protein
VVDRVIADFFEGRVGKFFVFELEFLKAHDIGFTLSEPRENELEARPQAIDIPRGDFHRRSPGLGLGFPRLQAQAAILLRVS